MIVTAHQVGYLPWAGLFDRVAQCDVLVVLDNVQYERHGFNNRNRIKTANGVQWLTVPVHSKGHFRSSLGATVTLDSDRWVYKHLTAIRQAYGKAPHFGSLFDGLAHNLFPGARLIDINLRLFTLLARHLGIGTRIIQAGDLPCHGTGMNLIASICGELEAKEFLFGGHGLDYINSGLFERTCGAKAVIHRYRTPEHPQLHGAFEPNLSAIDLLMNCGPDSARIMRQGGTLECH
jgi:hypothetical protein